MIQSVRRFAIATACVWSLVCAAANAATLPPGFTERLVVSGLTNPTAMAFAPDGRLFVCLQAGQIRVIKDGALLHDPFLTLTVNSVGERGVLGIAFDPAFNSNQHVYIYYTATSPEVHNRVSRFTANGDVVAPGSELVLIDLNVEPLSGASNHNGGAIHFGQDGKLYVAIGDNGVGANSQSLNTRLGKVLRLNADGTIPSDNPFFGTATGVNRAIWALGLRNPFTFAVQPGSGRIFINDVGQSVWEEINDGVAGRQLRLAELRRAQHHQYRNSVQLQLRGAAVRVRPANERSQRVRHRRRRVLQPAGRAVPGGARRRLLLRRPVRRLDPQARSDDAASSRTSPPGCRPPWT